MKKIILYFAVLICSSFNGFSQNGVGINLNYPTNPFHLDAATTSATTNGATAVAGQEVDDVVMTNLGALVIGSDKSQYSYVKLRIGSGVMKLSDGTEGDRKALVSDADGFASWTNISGTWFAELSGGKLPATQSYSMRKVVNFPSANISSATEGSVNGVAGTIRVPFTGYYKVTLAAWMANGFTDMGVGVLYNAYPHVYLNGVEEWQPHVVGLAHRFGVSPSFVRIFKLNANDELSLYNNELFPSLTNEMNQVMLSVEYIK